MIFGYFWFVENLDEIPGHVHQAGAVPIGCDMSLKDGSLQLFILIIGCHIKVQGSSLFKITMVNDHWSSFRPKKMLLVLWKKNFSVLLGYLEGEQNERTKW